MQVGQELTARRPEVADVERIRIEVQVVLKTDNHRLAVHRVNHRTGELPVVPEDRAGREVLGSGSARFRVRN